MKTNLKKKFETILISFLILFSFLVNYIVASRGVFPVDTFIHFDQGFRILNGEHPIKDYWIVHGFIIDYIQSIFFLVLGNNWLSYISHSSVFNTIICLSSYYFFLNILKLKVIESLFFAILIALLSYPVSGTPFLDLHSSYFCLIGAYLITYAIVKKRNEIFWFYGFVLFFCGFLSKQVPAGYFIALSGVFCLYYSYINKNIKPIIFSTAAGLASTILLISFLKINEINIIDFIIQYFLFPTSFGENRFIERSLNFKNVILDYKFIYLPLIFLITINFYEIKIKKKKIFYSDKFNIFLIFFLYSVSHIFHQIYTKNQIYIFFLIPIISALLMSYLNYFEIEKKLILKITIFLFSLAVTIKYVERFDIKRKFHELANTDISNAIDLKEFDKKFSGLKWISPNIKDPKKEIENLDNFRSLLKKDLNNELMVITEYNFFSTIMNKSFNSPSRTYDNISYPKKNSLYFKYYKSFLIKKIKEKKIKAIYILENKKIDKKRLNNLIFNYISENCFIKSYDEAFIVILEIKSCKELNA